MKDLFEEDYSKFLKNVDSLLRNENRALQISGERLYYDVYEGSVPKTAATAPGAQLPLEVRVSGVSRRREGYETFKGEDCYCESIVYINFV